MRHDYAWLLVPGLSVLGLGPAELAHATQYLTVEQAQAALFGAGARYAPTLPALSEAQKAVIKAAAKTRTPLPNRIWAVERAGRHAGWFVVDEVYGKHEYISYAVALDASGRVRGLEILEYKETHGYEVREAAWRAQFVGKGHGAPLKLEQDIQNISGATLSCLHLAEGVRRILALHEQALKTRA